MLESLEFDEKNMKNEELFWSWLESVVEQDKKEI